jgi:chromosome segregation ATPase
MTLINTLKHILHYYSRVFLDTFSSNLPNDIKAFRKDCESLVERYNSLLKEISSYMKDHSKLQEDDPDNSELSLTYHDTDSFYLISIKEDLTILTADCKQLLEKVIENTADSKLYNEAIKQYLNQLQELRQYSVQIETALHEYEENIMKIEEEISNNTLCN